jgi:hypothetical protein
MNFLQPSRAQVARNCVLGPGTHQHVEVIDPGASGLDQELMPAMRRIKLPDH